MWEFLGKLKDKVKETKDKLRKSPEELASQKFDEIFYKIKESKYKNQANILRYESDGRMIIVDTVYGEDEMRIRITKYDPFMGYALRKDIKSWEFQLRTYHNDINDTIENLSPEQILNEILPNFEKRLNEAENYKKQEINNKIKEASKYAEAQDQKEADDLLKWLDDSSSLA